MRDLSKVNLQLQKIGFDTDEKGPSKGRANQPTPDLPSASLRQKKSMRTCVVQRVLVPDAKIWMPSANQHLAASRGTPAQKGSREPPFHCVHMIRKTCFVLVEQ